MPRPHLPRAAARCLSALVGSTLIGAVCAGAPASASVRAVVSFDGAAVTVGGVQVVRPLPALRMAVVDGSPAALARLARTHGVRGVAPDSAVELAGGPSSGEPVAASQGLGGEAGSPGAGQGVRVAVVDTGVSDTAALDRSSGRLEDSFDAGGAAAPFTDGYGHGTFMASVLAGGPVDGSDGRPVGVAPGATVLVVRVADADGTTSLSQVVAGLNWVAENSSTVDVANLSFSHTRPGQAYGPDLLTDAVERVRDSGVSIVVSAGNDPDVVGDPGFAPRALTVGAAELTGRPRVASFSGSDTVAGVVKPDVVANGVSVLGVLPPESVVARANSSSHVRGDLWRGSGTSQAAAVTSGVAALLLQHRPGLTPAQVKAAIRAAARPLPGGRDGAGLVRSVRGKAKGGKGENDPGPGGAGPDPSGEGGFDANSWSANSWSANSWSANSWSANSWSTWRGAP